MKKNNYLLSFFFIIISIFFANLDGAYLEKIPVKVTQPDGIELTLFASGDEYFNLLSDQEGYTVIQNPNTGYYVYAIRKNGELIASDYKVFPGRNFKRPNVNSGLMPSLKKIPIPSMETASVNNTVSLKSLTPKSGSIENIVIFVRFSNENEFTDPFDSYDLLFNKLENTNNEIPSLCNYFREVSYNRLNIHSSFYPSLNSIVVSYQDSHPRDYYKPFQAITNPEGYDDDIKGKSRLDRENLLLQRVLESINKQISNELNIDSDNDGFVDHVTFIISGQPEVGSSLLWPHHGNLDSMNIRMGDKRVSVYDIQFQGLLPTYGIGMLCHEMFHAIGSPDLYHFFRDGSEPVGKWDLMGQWPMNPPQHMNAYMKYRYGGWIDSIPAITHSGTYTLNPLSSSTNNCYKLVDPSEPSIYYILEYRENYGLFEKSLPGKGLVVYKIDTLCDGKGNGLYDPGEVSVFAWNIFTESVVSKEAENLKCLNISNIGISGSNLSFTINMPAVAKKEVNLNESSSSDAAIGVSISSSPVPVYVMVDHVDDSGLGSGTTNFTRTFSQVREVFVMAPDKIPGYYFKNSVFNGTTSTSRYHTFYTNATQNFIFNYAPDLNGALDNTALVFTTGGYRDWFIVTDKFYYGDSSVKSGTTAANQSSYMQTTVTGPATIKFYWKVSSEEDYDFLSFYLDDVLTYQISGDVTWHQKSVTFSSGNHKLKWVYSKDLTFNIGSDSGWVDKVEYITDLALNVTSPNGGETLESGSIYNITYSRATTALGGPYAVSLWRNGERLGYLFSANYEFSRSWIVGSYNYGKAFASPGSGYSIRVEKNESTIWDMSDNTFTISPSPLNITSPNGGETIARNAVCPITWTDTGEDDTVTLSLYHEGSKNGNIATGIPSKDEYYPWVAGFYSGGSVIGEDGYYIGITKENHNTGDFSDYMFKLMDQIFTILTPTQDGTTSLAMNITWKSAALTCGINIELWRYGSKVGDIALNQTFAPQSVYSYTFSGTLIGGERPEYGPGYQIRIEEPCTNGFGFSGVFTIREIPNLDLLTPERGGTFPLNSIVPITWVVNATPEKYISPGTYTLDLYQNNIYRGHIAQNLPEDATSYDWTVGSYLGGTVPTGTGYSIALTSSNGGMDSIGLFTITSELSPSLTVTSPNSGEIWPTGQIFPITWTSTGTISDVKIEYSTDLGSNWTTITDSTANTGNYLWTIPETPSTTCLVKISNTLNVAETDTSNDVFTLSDSPLITITSPNGGETLRMGSLHSITWVPSRLSNALTISIWKDGSKVGDIASGIANNIDSYQWTVGTYIGGTVAEGTDYSITISEENSDVSDSSNSTFSIITPTITLTTPNGNETWRNGTTRDITWTSSNLTGTLTFSLWKDGSKIGDIASGVSRYATYYIWTVGTYIGGTVENGTGYSIHINESNSTAEDSSDSTFSIDSASITVTNPNGGESIRRDKKFNITWTSSLLSDRLTISLYKDDVKIGDIATNVDNTMNSYSWYPGLIGSKTIESGTGYSIKITEDHFGTTDSCDSTFTIITPTITVTYPNGGESLRTGTTQDITWNSEGITEPIWITLLKNNSIYRQISTTVSPSTNSYSWPVGSALNGSIEEGSSYTFMIREGENGPYDKSDSTFSVLISSIHVTNPTSSYTEWKVGETRNITWDSTNLTETISISLWKGGIKIGDIVTDLPSTQNSYLWDVGTYIGGTVGYGTDYKLYVSQNNTTIIGTHNSSLTIVAPMLEISSPNGGEIWKPGSTQYINWATASISNPLSLSLWKDGVKVGDIATGLSSNLGSYSWKVGEYIGGTAPNGTGYTIKIIEDNLGTTDSSNAPFSIYPPTIVVSSPNGNENWRIGTSRTITWTSYSLTGKLTISLYRNGAKIGNIATDLSNSIHSYTWTTGNYLGGTAPDGYGYQIKIEEIGTTVSDLSDSYFSIIPASIITVNEPNGGETYSIGYPVNILWTGLNVCNPQRVTLWKDNTLIGIVADNIPMEKRSYVWKSAGLYEGGTATTGTGYKIKVEEIGTTYSDFSDAGFTLVDTPPVSQLILKSPNGGESLLVGKGVPITWKSIGIIGNVKIEYSVDNGLEWNTIIENTPNTGSYIWLVPDTPSLSCLVKLSDAVNTSINDVSNDLFSISGTQNLTLTSPNGGETLIKGTLHVITWSSSGVTHPFAITLWKNGTKIDTIAENIPSSARSFTWKVGELNYGRVFIPGSGFQIKIEVQERGGISDLSDAEFTIN